MELFVICAVLLVLRRKSSPNFASYYKSTTNHIPLSRGNFQSRGSTYSGTSQTPYRTSRKASYVCFSCGGSDNGRAQCKFRNTICNKCKRNGHLARACQNGNGQTNSIEQQLNLEDEVHVEEELYTVFDVDSVFNSEISVPLKIENKDCHLQLNT